jgi:2-hydroxy-6-oxonona-2,4-dienedioate hydrolase
LEAAGAWKCAEQQNAAPEKSHGKKMTHIIRPMQKYFPIAVIILVFSGWTGAAQPRQTAESKEVTVLGFKLHYLEAGKGAPVVLLHGLGGDGSRWGPNIEPLAKDFHVFALDQIGFGQSDKPLANYHTGMLSEFLVDFLKGRQRAQGVARGELDGRRRRALYRGAFPAGR